MFTWCKAGSNLQLWKINLLFNVVVYIIMQKLRKRSCDSYQELNQMVCHDGKSQETTFTASS